MIESFQYNGYTVEIHADECPESPREWDNLCQIVCFHRNYNLGDKHDYSQGDFNSWDDLKEQIEKDHDPIVITPIYLFDHSGLTIATDCGKFQACDSHGWDWGQIGFAFIPKQVAVNEYGVDHTHEIDDETIETCQKVLQGEVETYGNYVSGEVYGYRILDADGEEKDSCWGFFGYDNVVSMAKEDLDEANQKKVK